MKPPIRITPERAVACLKPEFEAHGHTTHVGHLEVSDHERHVSESPHGFEHFRTSGQFKGLEVRQIEDGDDLAPRCP